MRHDVEVTMVRRMFRASQIIIKQQHSQSCVSIGGVNLSPEVINLKETTRQCYVDFKTAVSNSGHFNVRYKVRYVCITEEERAQKCYILKKCKDEIIAEIQTILNMFPDDEGKKKYYDLLADLKK